jgi:hypothetical protein
MDGELATPACLIGRLGPWGKFEPGELRLEGGLVVFTSQERGLVFNAPVQEVRASFPKMYFGVAAKLAVRGKTYRLWFVPLQSMAGERASDFGEGRGETVVAGNKMLLKDFGPARAAVRQWRAALSSPTLAG